MSVAASPLPWRLVDGNCLQREGRDKVVLTGFALSMGPYSEADANTALIVHRVNTWDTLVDALQKIVNNWGDLHPKDRQQARAALHAARQEKDAG